MAYEPNFTVSAKVLDNVMRITEIITRVGRDNKGTILPQLRRINRLRSLHSSLAIEGNGLSLDDVSAIIDGKNVLGPQNEITEVKNAYAAYNGMDSFDPFDKDHLLKAHGIMMNGLIDSAGTFRTGSEGIFDKDGNCIHLAPGSDLVPMMLDNILGWTKDSDYPMIIKSCVFHYQFEYIHPFEDGNGRMGRLWHTLLLSTYDDFFKWIPVESMIRRHQREYYDAIEYSNQQSDCTPFLVFMTQMILEALEAAPLATTTRWPLLLSRTRPFTSTPSTKIDQLARLPALATPTSVPGRGSPKRKLPAPLRMVSVPPDAMLPPWIVPPPSA